MAHHSQLGEYRCPHRFYVRSRLNTSQSQSKGSHLIAYEPRLFSVDPPSQVVSPSEPVGILSYKLGFSYTAHPPQSLHDRRVPSDQLRSHNGK
jgi:hypothetical protein